MAKSMKQHTSLSIRFKSILLVFVLTLTSVLSAVPFVAPEDAQAAGFGSKLANTAEPDPNSTQEYGIWIDRALIYVYFNNRGGLDDGVSHAFSAEVDGLNGGNIDYKSGCRTISVSRANRDIDRPSQGTYKQCDGTESTITLVNQDSAFIDGYTYEENGETVIFMPRYISGVDGCPASKSGKYSADGKFVGNPSSDVPLNGTENKTIIRDFSSGSGEYATAKQHRNSQYYGDGCSLSYAGDGVDGGRTIYLLKDFTREDVQRAAASKINAFQTEKQRTADLTSFFQTDGAGLRALGDCQTSTGIGGSSADLIEILAQTGNQRGVNPFVDCMLDELNSSPEFLNAMNFTYEGNYEADLDVESDECSSGLSIPIIGDVACNMVNFVFKGLSSAFGIVINYFGNTADTFERFGNDQEIKTMWAGLRNIASVLFLIAFLVVVFQYLTNINVVDAYFVKKFIPRLVIAIVLVQASLWIVSEMNYIATDLGRSIQSLVLYGATGGSEIVLDVPNVISFGPFAIFGPGAVPVALIILIILFFVLLLAIIILVIRELLLVVLAVLAPLAFATLAIPQLESTAKKWLTSYVKLLAMYPIMMLFISVGAVVGNMLSNLGGFFALMGFIAYFLPFLILPFSFKLAGGIGGKIGGMVASLPKSTARAGMKGYKGYKKAEGMYEKHTPGGRERAQARKIKEQNALDAALRPGTDRAVNDMREARRGSGLRGKYSRYRAFGALEPDDAVMDRQIGSREESIRRQELEDAKHRFDNSQHNVAGAELTDASGNLLRNSGGEIYGQAGESVDTDDLYQRIARGETVTVTGTDGERRTLGGNPADQEMAMNQLAAFGRDQALRDLQDTSTPAMAALNANVNGAAMQRAIDNNSSALASKAQDLVKGEGVYRDKGVSAEALTQLSGDSIKKAVTDIHGTGEAAKIGSLQGEVQRLIASPTLFDQLSPASAKALHESLSSRGVTDPAIMDPLKGKGGIP